MSEPDDDHSGMGSAPRGPSFVPSSPATDRGPIRRPPADYHPVPLGPPRSIRPAVVSVLVIALVAAVVGVASLAAYWGDTHIAAPSPRAVAAPPSASSLPDRSDFVTADGSGQLIMRTRSWVRDGRVPPVSGQYLRLEVELICTQGEVDYDPYLFQAFDNTGRLFEMAVEGTGGRVLPIGTLTEGQRIRGTIAFDMPRGEVTLLMSDESDNAVTALLLRD